MNKPLICISNASNHNTKQNPEATRQIVLSRAYADAIAAAGAAIIAGAVIIAIAAGIAPVKGNIHTRIASAAITAAPVGANAGVIGIIVPPAGMNAFQRHIGISGAGVGIPGGISIRV